MELRRWKRIGFGSALLAAAVSAQQSATPRSPTFEVVSIRPVPPNAPPIVREWTFTPVLPGGQFVDSRTNLLFMIAFAYDVEDPSTRLVGLPRPGFGAYSVSAKPAAGFPALPETENKKQVQAMMRAMLEDRFHLKLHTELRQEQIYRLGVAKGGLKIKEVDSPVAPAQENPVSAAMGDDGGHIVGKKSTMVGFARMLVVFLKRPVVDETGLKGYYDFDVRWRAPESPGGDPPSSRLGPSGIGLLISNIKSQFGLQVSATKGQVKYWVVDHVEPPTEN